MPTRSSPLAARPRVLSSKTGRITTTLGTAFVTMTCDPQGEPFEVFLNVGKAGSETFATAEALGRLISLVLRISSPVTRSERIREITNQLEFIGSLANDASLPSIADALAKILRDFSAEAASDELFQLQAPDAVFNDAYQSPSLREAPPETEPRGDLPVMDLSLKRNRKKQSMNTTYSLPEEILTAAEQLASAILQDGPVAAYHQAKARLDGDAQARELLERFLKAQSELRVRQSRNAITQADVDELRALQQEVQANRIIIDYAETQQAAIAYLPWVNQEISQLLGVDFASLAKQSSC